MATRLDDIPLSTRKRARLHRLLYGAGPANGTLLLLPLDQGLEHGPRDFFPNPASADPRVRDLLALAGAVTADHAQAIRTCTRIPSVGDL